ncbi:AMP-binding protein [Pseudomonas sp. NPDC007930]|uniref:class I adenylate-forming enzyme family protein n=1 Tax=Pseudomonas sp. NPDC007930 TaxID=3364417 RepID=UPI0036E0516B
MRSNLMTLHDPSLARQYYDQGLWQNVTLYGMARRNAERSPEACAVRDRARSLSWQQLLAWSDALAADLHAAGLRTGDRVAAWLPSRAECFVLYLACSRNGYVCSQSLHQNHTVEDVLTLLERVGTRAFIGQPGWGADSDQHCVFSRLAAKGGMCRVYALNPHGSTAGLPTGALAFPGLERQLPLPPENTNPDKVVYLAYTSGTTGLPKALMHSDNTLLANGRALVADWQVSRDTVMFCLGPVSHHIATVGFEQQLVSGCELVVNDVAKGESLLQRILATGASYLLGVPTHAIDLLQAMRREGVERLGQVHTFYMAGAAIPAEIARRLIELGVTPQNIYGMTENGSHHCPMRHDEVAVLTRTVGQAVGRQQPVYEVKLFKVDDKDSEAGPGEIGEIGGRGAVLMLGYFGNDAATQGSFNSSGWFMSGDLGTLDAHGNLSIVGRSKDLIIRGGHNIYPAEIENFALRHPLVFKAAAFPVPDERLGEKVCLGIITVGGEVIDGQQMLEFLADAGLSKFDMPEYFYCAEAFPLTASGKILKRALCEQVKAGSLAPQPVRWVARAQGTCA